MRGRSYHNSIYIGSVQKRLFFLAFLTSFAAAFSQTLAVLVDNVIVCAFYGEAEIAAVSLAEPFFYLLEIPAAGLAAGIQAVCARELGAGRIQRVNRLFNQIVWLAAPVLLALTVLAFLGVPRMAVLFGARGNTAALRPYAVQYLYGLAFEILPYVLFCVMSPVIVLDNGGRLISIASAAGCVTDIALDLLSVRMGWGLFGIGLASSASALVFLLVTLLHFLKKDRVLRLRFTPLRPAELKDMLIAAGPKAALSLADALSSGLFIALVSATGGVVGTAVLSIHGTLNYFLTIFITGVAGAVGILAGIGFGEKNGEELESLGLLGQRYCLLLSALVMALLGLIARPLAAALTESNEAAALLRFAIGCMILQFPLSALVHARIGYLQAVGRIKAAQWMGIAVNLAFLAAAGCLLALLFGVRGAFLAFPVSSALTLLLSWALHVRQTGKALPAGSDYLELDKSFFVPPGDIISYPIATAEDCSLAAEQVTLFCRGHRLAERKALLAALCTEELCSNVIEHGLNARRAYKAADLRVVLDSGDVILRVRDGGPAFKPERLRRAAGEAGRAPRRHRPADPAGRGQRAQLLPELRDEHHHYEDLRGKHGAANTG